jgi:hypothetical protein
VQLPRRRRPVRNPERVLHILNGFAYGLQDLTARVRGLEDDVACQDDELDEIRLRLDALEDRLSPPETRPARAGDR